MAEILIKIDGPDMATNLNAWSRLLPVAVKPDGWTWGAAERPPKFLVVRIADTTVPDAEAYLVDDSDWTDPENPIVNAIRKWKFDIDDATIPKVVKKKINAAIANGTILEVTTAQIAAYIKRTRKQWQTRP